MDAGACRIISRGEVLITGDAEPPPVNYVDERLVVFVSSPVNQDKSPLSRICNHLYIRMGRSGGEMSLPSGIYRKTPKGANHHENTGLRTNSACVGEFFLPKRLPLWTLGADLYIITSFK